MLGALYRTTLRIWVVLAALAFFFLDVSAGEVLTSIALSALFAAIGVAAALLVFFFGSSTTARFKYLGETLAGASVELKDERPSNPSQGWIKVVVPTPYPLMVRSDIELDAIIPPDLAEHWAFLCRHDEYVKAFHAVMRYLASHPQTPAATVPGGHRGATLLEHSFNVWRTMRNSIANFEYHGMRDRTGRITLDLMGGENAKPYIFEPDDPLPYLAAIAHDIGKIACYQPTDDGRWTEVLPEHDSEGAKILRRLRIYELMPREEAQRLIVTVGHYHKLESVPTARWIDDRCRALLNLLYDVDVHTGKLESQGAYDAYISKVVISKHQQDSAPQDLRQETETDSLSTEPTIADPSILGRLTGQPQGLPDLLPPTLPALSHEDTPVHTPLSHDSTQQTTAAPTTALQQGPLDTIVIHCKQIESALEKHFGAIGQGLHSKVDSIAKKLPDSLVRRIRFVATIRNKAIHESDFTVDERLMTKYLNICKTIHVEIDKLLGHSRCTNNPLDHTISDDEIIALVAEVLTMGGAINGKKDERVAYKYREWLYIYERDLCRLIDEALPSSHKEHYGLNKAALFPDTAGKHADFTRRLMTALANKGALRQEWNGSYYGDHSAYFWVAPARKPKPQPQPQPEQEAQRSAHVIVCRAYAFGNGIFRMKSCQFEPVIQGCVYQPLKDPKSIERVKQRMAAWQEPQLPEDQALEERLAKEKARANALMEKNPDIGKAPFEPSLISAVPADELTTMLRQDPEHGNLFRIDVVLKYFSQPIVPVSIVEIDGVRYYSFGSKPRRR